MHDFLTRLPESVLWQKYCVNRNATLLLFFFTGLFFLLKPSRVSSVPFNLNNICQVEINQAEDGTDIDYSKYNDLNLISLLFKTGR